MLVCVTVFYFSIKKLNHDHVENNLLEEKEEIIRRSRKIQNYYIEDELSDELFIEEIPLTKRVKDSYKAIYIYDSLEQEEEPYLQLETSLLIAGKNYKIDIRKSLVENSTLMFSTILMVLLMVLILSASFVIITRILSGRVWKPFYTTLDRIKKYRIGHTTGVALPKEKVEEFNELNTVFNKMIDQINKDYFIQKEFIDIISHEYQTPLSVISMNVELMAQDAQLDEEQIKKIQTITDSVYKLSRMNKALLLLSRIDNNQFQNISTVTLAAVINQQLKNFDDQIGDHDINLETVFKSDLNIEADKVLAEILIRNLIQNAIRHNINGGEIFIETLSKTLIISNTGKDMTPLPSHDIFQKFTKKSNTSDSIGLGLNIVKAICNSYGYTVSYTFNRERKHHTFIVYFKK